MHQNGSKKNIQLETIHKSRKEELLIQLFWKIYLFKIENEETFMDNFPILH